MSEINEQICYYHGDMDGIASAAIVKLVFPDCKLVKVNYGDEWKVEDIKNKLVIVVDFSFPDMSELRRHSKLLCWCDHHQSAKDKNPKLWNSDAIDGLREINKAGCELTWEWFFPHEEIPDAIKLIADRDLWKFEYSGTEAFNERLYDITNDPEDSIWFVLLTPNNKLAYFIRQIVQDGQILLEAKSRRIKQAFDKGHDKTFNGYRCRIMNATSDISEVGHYAVEQGYDIGVVWRRVENDISVSLRSEGAVDVSIIAKSFGGGGHKNAAGFSLNDNNIILEDKNDK